MADSIDQPVPSNEPPVTELLPKQTLSFDVVELQKISLKEGDILAVKLVGDDFDVDTMESLRDSLKQVFVNNKVMIFTMPRNSDIQFSAIESEPVKYCSDCSCGKKERAENVKDDQPAN